MRFSDWVRDRRLVRKGPVQQELVRFFGPDVEVVEVYLFQPEDEYRRVVRSEVFALGFAHLFRLITTLDDTEPPQKTRVTFACTTYPLNRLLQATRKQEFTIHPHGDFMNSKVEMELQFEQASSVESVTIPPPPDPRNSENVREYERFCQALSVLPHRSGSPSQST